MKKLILSVDTGIDDALAIAYAAGQQDLTLIGLTASYGMSTVQNTYRNTKRLAALLHADVPVYMGSAVPLTRPGRDYKAAGGLFHGRDGMANLLGDAQAADVADAAPGDAIDFLISSIHRYQKDLILVTTGPVTDLARAIQKDPTILGEVGAIYSMMGALATPGNVSPYKEANAGLDPEAAKVVLEANPPLTVVGLDVTRKVQLTMEDLARWQQIPTDAGSFFSSCVTFYLDAYRKLHPYLNGCALHDPLAVGAALHPEWLTTVPMHLTCVTEGEADGRTCEDLSRSNDIADRTKGAFFVNGSAFKQNFFETVERVLNQK